MREDKDNLTVLDHIDGISVPGSVFESAVNEYWALRTHRDGLFFLYHQVAKCEEKARHGFNPEGKLKVIAYGNLPPLTNLPMGLLACAFQWYTISACQYVRTVGAIARMQDQRRPLPRKYAEAVIPELLVYRDKVAAHYSWTYASTALPKVLA